MDPQIQFTFDPEIPIVGEPFTATCQAEISQDLNGSIQLEWRDEDGEIIVIGQGNNSAEISFTIESYSMANATVIGGFNCRAVISAEDDMRNYDIVLGRNILFTCEGKQHAMCSYHVTITSIHTYSVFSQQLIYQYHIMWRFHGRL